MNEKSGREKYVSGKKNGLRVTNLGEWFGVDCLFEL